MKIHVDEKANALYLSGYDEGVWPIMKAAIEEHRISERTRFSD